tara:strand:- start:138 stop:905 length:768 start_codon:yes stop_codon:yes gene_type:complete
MQKFVEIDVETTDDIVNGSIDTERFFPSFRHMTRGGELKIMLFGGCACSLYIRFAFDKQGVGMESKDNKCDLCLKNDEDNAERVGAIMDGISEVMHKIMSTNKGVEVMKSGVTRSGVMDGSEIGAIVSRDKVENMRVSPEKLNDTTLETDSQFLLTALEVVLGMIELGNLNDQQKMIYGKTIEIVGMLKQKDSFKKPTEQIKQVLKKAKDEIGDLNDEKTKQMFSDMVHYDDNEIENLVDEIKKDNEKKENETNE